MRAILAGGDTAIGQHIDGNAAGLQVADTETSVEPTVEKVDPTIVEQAHVLDMAPSATLFGNGQEDTPAQTPSSPPFHTYTTKYPSLLQEPPPFELDGDDDDKTLVDTGSCEGEMDVFVAMGTGKEIAEVDEVEGRARIAVAAHALEHGEVDTGSCMGSTPPLARSPDILETALAELYLSPITPYTDVRSVFRSIFVPVAPETPTISRTTTSKFNGGIITELNCPGPKPQEEEKTTRRKKKKAKGCGLGMEVLEMDRAEGEPFRHLSTQLKLAKLIPGPPLRSAPGPLTLNKLEERVRTVEVRLGNLLASWGYTVAVYEDAVEENEEESRGGGGGELR